MSQFSSLGSPQTCFRSHRGLRTSNAVGVRRCASAISKPPGLHIPRRLENTRELGAQGSVKSTVSFGLGGSLPLFIASDAFADTEVPTVLFGLSPIETVLLFAPVTLYGIFWVYRSAINPQAKLLDFLFISAAVVIVLNIVSIIFFRVRIF